MLRVQVPSIGRALKWYDSASLCCVCERTIRPETGPLSLLCDGFESHQKPSHLWLSRFNRQEYAFCIFGHKQAWTLIPHNRLASRRVLYSSFRVPVTSVPSCCWMRCRHHCPARCRVDSKRDVSESNFGTQCCCSKFCLKFHDNPSSYSGSNFCARFHCSNFCGHLSARSEPSSQFCDDLVLNTIFSSVTINHHVLNTFLSFVAIHHRWELSCAGFRHSAGFHARVILDGAACRLGELGDVHGELGVLGVDRVVPIVPRFLAS